jgi:hypothetical protein
VKNIKNRKIVCVLALSVIAFGLRLDARDSDPGNFDKATWHPGEAIPMEIKFEGKDAGMINQIQADLVLTNKAVATSDTHVFLNEAAMVANKEPDGVFRFSIKLPEWLASGEYRVTVQAFIGSGITYNSPQDFDAPLFRVVNTKTFEKPRLKFITPAH